MAIGHITMGSTVYANQLRQALGNIANGLNLANNILAEMSLMKDGNSYTQYIVDKFGFLDATGAQAAFDELNSVLSKLNTDASVSNVNAAIFQAYRKLA